MKNVVIFFSLVPLVLLAGSSIGAIHPLGDSLAVFRFHLGWAAALGGVILFALQWMRTAIAAAILGGVAVVTIWISYAPRTPSADMTYSLYQKNVLIRIKDNTALIADIKAKDADFVTLQELPPRTPEILQALEDQYQTIVYCTQGKISGLGIASKYPMVDGTKFCAQNQGLAIVQVTTPDGPLWLVSQHLSWPFPYRQKQQVDVVAPILEKLDGPVVLAGDFNMVPWSDTMTRIEAATGSHRVGETTSTFHLYGLVKISIDHVLAPTECAGTASALDLLGSDHHGVLARFTLDPC